ncbi:MAG: O-antigen ligase family protein [Synergistaceae bacterium]|nr:O-antigen ligase family protein [Synergistaceae bacterium]
MKINKHFLMYTLMTIPFLPIGGFLEAMHIKGLVSLMKFFAAVFILYQYLFSHKHKFNMLDTVFFAYEAFLMLNTFMHGISLFETLKSGYIFSNMIIFMLYEIGFDNSKQFIRSQFTVFLLIILMNLATELAFPGGLYASSSPKVWLLGYYNTHSTLYVMAILMACLYAEMYRKQAGAVLTIAAIYAAALLVKSGGTLAFLSVTAVLLVFYRRTRLAVNYYMWWIVLIVFFMGIIVLHSSEIGRRVYAVSEYAFSKGGSLLGRMQAWVYSFAAFLRNPVFGYGFVHTEQYGWAMHAHNLVLEILHQGGLVQLMLFALMIFTAGHRLRRIKNVRLYCAISTAFAGWIIISLVEPFMTPFLMALFVVAFRAGAIEKVMQNNTQ